MIVDTFAGPGGWDEGLKMIGRTDVVGLEWDAAACATAHAAGHARIRTDVATYPTDAFGEVEGFISSPPCTDFSTAGAMKRLSGSSGHLVAQVMRYAEDLQPEWIAAEQVPQVLPIWQAHAYRLRAMGYSVWTGIVNAADYGVPQDRRRALLLASRRSTVTPPAPTHAAEPSDALFGDAGRPWVTLAETCGLPKGCEYDSGQNSRAAGGGTVRYIRSCDRPSGTLTGQSLNQWVLSGAPRRKLTTMDGARLQTFPADYPWSGTREEVHQQIGNAVPPLLAAHVLSALGVGALPEAVAA